MTYNLYALSASGSKEIHYIGQTRIDCKKRLKQHITRCKSPSQPKYHISYWIISLLKTGKFPKVHKICTRDTQEEIDIAETAAIARLRAKGAKLCNISNGGQVAVSVSLETKQKMSEAKKGSKNSFFGKHHSKETREKIRAFAKQRTPWNKGKKVPQQSGENNPFYGKSHTKETREKISKANKGKPGGFKGKHLSDEVKEAIRIRNSKTYYFLNPNGEKVTITNLAKFSRDNNLSACSMHQVAVGWRNKKHYHGWKPDPDYNTSNTTPLAPTEYRI